MLEIRVWLVEHGLKILLILAALYLAKRFGHLFIERAVRKFIVAGDRLSEAAEKKREDTIVQVFSSTLSVLVWIVGAMTILSEVGVEIGPLLAAAGVAGVALGFGGQYLIRDIITGLFIIFENQYQVGDVVCVKGTCGLVESINLRLTVLRDLDGTVHHIPNGEVTTASNLSKRFARVNLNIGVSYDSDLEQVIAAVNRVGNDLAADPAWRDKITKPPEFLRVDDFADSAIVIKILGETKPLEQWAVAGELRRRLKTAFDREGIEIPFPQRVIHSPSDKGLVP